MQRTKRMIGYLLAFGILRLTGIVGGVLLLVMFHPENWPPPCSVPGPMYIYSRKIGFRLFGKRFLFRVETPNLWRYGQELVQHVRNRRSHARAVLQNRDQFVPAVRQRDGLRQID